MKKKLHPVSLIFCFFGFYLPFVLSSSGQNLSDLESHLRGSDGGIPGSFAREDYSTVGELEKFSDKTLRLANPSLAVVEYFEDDLFIPLAEAQQRVFVSLTRSTTGIAGSSKNIATHGKTYVMQQSVGQASPIGTFTRKIISPDKAFYSRIYFPIPKASLFP